MLFCTFAYTYILSTLGSRCLLWRRTLLSSCPLPSGTCVCVKQGREGMWGFLIPRALLPKDVIDPSLGRQGRFRKVACVVELEGLWQCKDFTDNQRICLLERKKGCHLMVWRGKRVLTSQFLCKEPVFYWSCTKGK